MKKTAFLIISLLLCVATLASCGLIQINPNGIESEGWTEVTADTKDDCFTLLDSFMEETLKNANVVVTVEGNGAVQYVESIVGDKNCVDHKSTDTKVYAFKQDNEFISAVDGDTQYYMVGEEFYNNNYCYFLYNVRMLKEEIPADQATFTGKMRTEEKNGESSSTLTFEITSEIGNVKITAEAKNGLVLAASYIINDPTAGQRTTTLTFAYGNAVVTLPDITDWYNATSDAAGDEEPDFEEDEEDLSNEEINE